MFADILLRTSSLTGLLSLVIIIAGLIAVTLVALRAMGTELPSWLMQILMIAAIVVVAIVALHVIGGL